MKSCKQNRVQRPAGSALVLTLVMSGVALLVLTGAMTWSATNTKLTDRSNRYSRGVAAGESAIEKILTQMNKDFFEGGEGTVWNHMTLHRSTVPSSADSAYWANWEISHASGHPGQTYVQRGMAS